MDATVETLKTDPEQLLNLIRFRRTIRGFDQHRDISDEALNNILEAACWAPSAANGQPCEFVVVRDQEMRGRIADLYMAQMEDKKILEKAVRGFTRIPGDGFRNAPVHVIVMGDPRVDECYTVRSRIDKGERHLVSAMSNASIFIQLMAASYGIGSQYVSDAASPYMSTMLKLMLKIPDRMVIYELIPLGYPLRWPDAPPRRPLSEIVHNEMYEDTKYRTDEQVKAFLYEKSRLGAYGRKKHAAPGNDVAPEDQV